MAKTNAWASPLLCTKEYYTFIFKRGLKLDDGRNGAQNRSV